MIFLVAALGCERDVEERPSATATATAIATATATAAAADERVRDPACPGDMALVAGGYCPLPQQVCVDQPKIVGAPGYEQCQRYDASKCLSRERVPMRFCMDRYEWPNEKGQKPRTLTSWLEARRFCEGIGKRLCNEDEWTFACEGEPMRPHVHGWQRDGTVCHYDQPYIRRTFNYHPWDRCMADEACRKEYERLDQRLPAGSKPLCVNEHGVYDLNGNANEWVYRLRPGGKHPYRSGLKGGWWGPVRDRCRPMTTFHPEGDYGYEVGFRCCKDPQG